MRSLFFPLLTAATIALSGCAAEPEDDAGMQAGAISPAEAVGSERFEVQQRLLADEPASPEAQSLGVVSWTVYAVASESKNVAGTVAYAVDRDGDVKYAAAKMGTLDGSEQSIGFFELAKNGAKTELDASKVAGLTKQLSGDLTSLDRKLQAHGAEGRGQGAAGLECALRISLIGVGGIAAAFAGVGTMTVGVAVAAKAAGASGLVGAVVATLVSLAGVPVGAAAGVSVAAAITTVSETARQVIWTDTLDVCKRAVK